MRAIAKRLARRIDLGLADQLRVNRADLPGDPADIEDFVRTHTELIKTVGKVVKKRVAEVVEANQGLHVDALTAKLLADTKAGVSVKKAKQWAVDQTLKLHAKATKTRQESAGIEEYIWTDSGGPSGDGKGLVRPMHRALDGKRFKWSTPPVTNEAGDRNHPGEDFNCRCTAYPVTAAGGVLGRR